MFLNVAAIHFFLLMRNHPLNKDTNICWCNMLLMDIGVVKSISLLRISLP